MNKKRFELGKDVERALMEIVSINDDLPADFKERMEVEKDERCSRESGM